MKLCYSRDQVDRWRDRVHRKTPRLAIASARQALAFINDVGFCFAFKAEHSELPCLLHAVAGSGNPILSEHTHQDPAISFVWDMKEKLPGERKVYYGRLLKHRPTMVSLDYLPYFYVLSGRSGMRDEHSRDFVRGRISAVGREIMDALVEQSPQPTKGLKLATGLDRKSDRALFDKAITELQEKMYLAKIAEEHTPFSFVWAPVRKCYADQVRAARRIAADTARVTILRRYFHNQLLASVPAIHRLFRWQKQDLYRALGTLVGEGAISPNATIAGEPGRYYCLIGRD
jgi:hypothetical protein